MEEVKKGRIVYFEPNELFGGDNQPVDQEDLTKYINLSVRIPSRFYNESELKRNYESILGGTTFIEKDDDNREYTKLYLTDNYVNVSYTEFGKNGEINNGELFGIESINISFDTQFFPVVTIVFTDVKGYGLMSTMEYNYEKDSLKNLTAKSFFTSLFNFPYPVFNLEVKGYYGKGVSIDLALKDFNTSFDSNTGNFKTIISFIGHLYGVYADIPMPYLMVSPYIDYTTETEMHTSKIWDDLPYKDIPTYLNFIEKYNELLLLENVELKDKKFFIENTKKREEIQTLNKIYNYYLEIINYGKNVLSNYTIENKNIIEKDNNDNPLLNSIYNEKYKYFDDGKKIVIILGEKDDLSEVCFAYRDLERGLLNGDFKEIYKLNFKEIKINDAIDNIKNFKFLLFDDIFSKKLKLEEEVKKITNTIENTLTLENNEINELVTTKMGFNPTIKNVYKMLFKHLDCFSKQFYKVIKQINLNREIVNQNIPYFIENIDGVIPPFPTVYIERNGKKEITYPGEVDSLSNIPELVFVEKINDCVSKYANKFQTAVRDLNNIDEAAEITDIKGFGPFLMDHIDTINGSYFILQRGENKPTTINEIADAIKDTFLARLNTYSRMYYTEDGIYDEDYFIDKEVVIIFNAFSHLDIGVVDILESFKNNKTTLFNRFNRLSGGTGWGFITFPYKSSPEEKNDSKYKKICNNTFETSFIIFNKGKKDDCTNYINEHFDSNTAFIFPTLSKNGLWGGKYYPTSPYKINQLEKTSYCIQGQGKNGCRTWQDYYYQRYETIYTSIEYLGKPHPFFRWFAEEYKSVTDSISCGDPVCTKTITSSTVYSKRDTLNRIVNISLLHLLAIGEAFYYSEDDSFYVGASVNGLWTRTGSNKFYFAKNFITYAENFKELLIGLYKKFFNINPSEEDEKYYNFFGIPSDITTREQAIDYWFVIGKGYVYRNNKIGTDEEKTFDIWVKFIKKLRKQYGYENITIRANNNEKNEDEIKNNKINIYYTLKNLYEKWFCGLPSNHFDINRRNGEFRRFNFLTTTYRDISNELLVNIDVYVRQIIGENLNGSSKNVISFMSSIAQKNLSTFIVLPFNIFNFDLKESFKPIFQGNCRLNFEQNGSTYVIMYNEDVSHYLDLPNSENENDGFMIADFKGNELEITDEAARIAEVLKENEYTIPAFGVTYGMQNQNYFNNINIDTQTPQMTDYAIANMLNIAEQGSNLSNGLMSYTKNESIYPVYANRSYNCSVEMLGCMNIMPLMFFQLNNVPMFKGAYIITNVEHNITPNDFKTIFSGVRVSKYNIPINTKLIDLSRIGSLSNIVGDNMPSDNNNDNTTFSSHSENATYEIPDIGKINFITVSKNEEEWAPYENSCGKDCMASAKLSAKRILSGNKDVACDAYTSYGSSSYVVQLLYEKLGSASYNDNGDYKLYYEESDGYDREHKYKCCVDYMKKELSDEDSPAPIIVGVTHSLKRWNDEKKKWLNEGVSDHFLCVYAYGETSDGKVYFKYFESGRGTKGDCVNNRNILIYDPNNGNPKFYCLNSTRKKDKQKFRRYDVSQVRIYDKHINRFSNRSLIGPQKEFNQFTGDNVYLSLAKEYMYANQK